MGCLALVLLGSLAWFDDTAEILERLDAVRARVGDVSFEYEGRMQYPTRLDSDDPDLDAEGVYDVYRGAYIRRDDGAFFLDVFHRYPSKPSEVVRETIARVGDRVETHRRKTDSPRAAVSPIQGSHSGGLGDVSKILHVYKVLSKLNSGSYKGSLGGMEEIDGVSCLIVDVVLANDEVPSNKVRERYWLDMNRGGVALKWELFDDGAVCIRVVARSLGEFQDGKNSKVWLPMDVVWESFADLTSDVESRSYGAVATNRETFRVFPESVRVNSGFKDDRFNVRFKNGSMITSALKQVRGEFGRQAPPPKTRGPSRAERAESHAKVQTAFDAQVQQAESEGDILLASSRERDGFGWLDWAPWGITLMSLAALAIVGVRHCLGVSSGAS